MHSIREQIDKTNISYDAEAQRVSFLTREDRHYEPASDGEATLVYTLWPAYELAVKSVAASSGQAWMVYSPTQRGDAVGTALVYKSIATSFQTTFASSASAFLGRVALQNTSVSSPAYALEYGYYAAQLYPVRHASYPAPTALSAVQAQQLFFGTVGFVTDARAFAYFVAGGSLCAVNPSAAMCWWKPIGLDMATETSLRLWIVEELLNKMVYVYLLRSPFRVNASLPAFPGNLNVLSPRVIRKTLAETMTVFLDPLSGTNTALLASDIAPVPASRLFEIHTSADPLVGTNRHEMDQLAKIRNASRLEMYANADKVPLENLDDEAQPMWKYTPRFPYAVLASDKTQLEKRMTPDRYPTFGLWVNTISRNATFAYESEGESEGLRTHVYRLTNDVFEVNPRFDQYVYGVGNLTTPRNGAPIVFALPNHASFEYAELAAHLNKTVRGPAGLAKWAKEDYSTTVEIEPFSGLPVRAELHLGISYLLVQNTSSVTVVELFQAFKYVVYPGTTDVLENLRTLDKWNMFVPRFAIPTIVIGVVSLLASAILFFRESCVDPLVKSGAPPIAV